MSLTSSKRKVTKQEVILRLENIYATLDNGSLNSGKRELKKLLSDMGSIVGKVPDERPVVVTSGAPATQVGFWSKNDGDDGLPVPEVGSKPWNGQAEFITALDVVEARLTPIAYRGFSRCRVCGCHNGSQEYDVTVTLDLPGYKQETKLQWPSGYRHYVVAHNVRPPKEFVRTILNMAKEFKSK